MFFEKAVGYLSKIPQWLALAQAVIEFISMLKELNELGKLDSSVYEALKEALVRLMGDITEQYIPSQASSSTSDLDATIKKYKAQMIKRLDSKVSGKASALMGTVPAQGKVN